MLKCNKAVNCLLDYEIASDHRNIAWSCDAIRLRRRKKWDLIKDKINKSIKKVIYFTALNWFN